MAAQVLSGSSDATYTNNTGENVRVIINFMESSSTGLSISWAGISTSNTNSGTFAIGRQLAGQYQNSSTTTSLPTELMLAPTQSFSSVSGPYNIVVIPEGG